MKPLDDKIPDDVLWHQSGVNRQGEPFVQLLRGVGIVCQMSPEQARDHARAITEAAEAAEQDAFMLTFLQQTIQLGFEEAMVVLMEFRAYRVQRTGKKSGAAGPRDWVMPEGSPSIMRGGSITCPHCHMTSYNPNDIEQGYCGFCHKFHDGRKGT